MKNPDNKVELRDELCKALKKNVFFFGYNMKDEVDMPFGGVYGSGFQVLRNTIVVCDRTGENDICIIEVKDGISRLYLPPDDFGFELAYEINYAYAGSKNDFFMEVVNGIIMCIDKRSNK